MEENTAIFKQSELTPLAEEAESARASIKQTAEELLENGIRFPATFGFGSGFGGDTLFGDDGDNELIGGDGRNSIVGNGGNDTIFGSAGTVFIDGSAGDDSILAAGGELIINGSNGNDVISGGDNRDFLIGNDGNDSLIGGDNEDILIGNGGNDSLIGDGGDDILSGDVGNDLIIGGSGNDIIAGVSLEDGDSEPGEIDTLVGGAGSDLFWLGDAENYDYDGGLQSGFLSSGTGDYGLIRDFSLSEDLIQLNGSADQYITIATGFTGAGLPSGTAIFRNERGFSSFDLVAVVEGIDPSQLSLTDTSQFTYV